MTRWTNWSDLIAIGLVYLLIVVRGIEAGGTVALLTFASAVVLFLAWNAGHTHRIRARY